MSSNSNKSNKSNSLNGRSEITIYSPGEINVPLKSNTKYLEMYKEDFNQLKNNNNNVMVALLKDVKCMNNGKYYYNGNEDKVVIVKFNSFEELFIKRKGVKFEYVPKAYILLLDKNNFNKRKFEIEVNKKTLEEIEEELITNYSELKEDIKYINKLKLNRLKKEELRAYIKAVREQAEKNKKLLDYYLSSTLRE